MSVPPPWYLGVAYDGKELEKYDVSAVVEPYMCPDVGTGKPQVPSQSNWQAITPTVYREDGNLRHSFRAELWINAKVRANAIPIQSHDIAAATVETETGPVLMVAAYDPRDGHIQTQQEQNETIAAKIGLIVEAIEQTKGQQGQDTEVVVCSDFNRHDPLWGGLAVMQETGRQNEGEAIIQMASEYNMQSLLQPGTVTRDQQTRGHCSTVDVILATTALSEGIMKCERYEVDHGSDHYAINIIADLRPQRSQLRIGRRMYEKANWEAIRTAVSQALPDLTCGRGWQTSQELETAAEVFGQCITSQLGLLVARAKPSPYAKRWLTPTLTTLRQAMTTIRNQVTTNRRRGDDTTEVKTRLRAARRLYFQEMERQKKTHWKEFLDDPTNIWKANSYTKLANTVTAVPTLQKGAQVADTDEDKAALLMDTFFPIPPEPQQETRATAKSNQHRGGTGVPKSTPLITAGEVRRAIWSSNPKKAPGEDEITFGVWRELWPVVKNWLVALFRASIHLGYLPRSWRLAKIVAIRKPGKSDYTAPKAYRPISLLATISKTLEKVVARRLSYLAEQYQLLPTNHCGGRPRRSSEQAVDVLIERIHEAWRARRVLSLITFDVQGAFNGVHTEVLCERLRERQVPTKLVKWTQNFCSDRTGTVVVGQYTSENKAIQHAGIPQGSPLSPILYVFYNANLVEQKIDIRGGSLGFIDDFTAWVTSATAEINTQKIQETIILKAESWVRESGATFEADKTGFVHFSRQKEKMATQPPLSFNGTDIKAQDKVKILGVILDQKLKMDAHIERVTTAATAKCLGLARLKGIRPKQMRQLYRSVVLPTTDYAASSWFSQDRRGIGRLVNRVQRVQKLGARIILRVFRSVSTQVIEAEASLEPVAERLARKTARHVVGILSLPEDNPLQQSIIQLKSRGKTWPTPIQETWKAFRKRYDPVNGPRQIALRPWLLSPWKDRTEQCLILEDYQAKIMIRKERGYGATVIYTDGSVRNGTSGCAAVKEVGTGGLQVVEKATIGWARTCSVLSTELQAIKLAVDHLLSITGRIYNPIIATDSQEPLQTIIKSNEARRGREALQGLIDALAKADTYNIKPKLLWIPAHDNIPGNELAHQTAQGMTEPGSKPTKDFRLRIRDGKVIRKLVTKDVEQQKATEQRRVATSQWGKYTWNLDAALPGKHTLKLYGSPNSNQAAVLVQARTNHTPLKSYLARIGVEESARCGCGREDETVEHVLLRCSRWIEARKELRAEAGNRWGDLSFLLGGYSKQTEARTAEPRDGPMERWAPNLKIVKSTIQFLQQTTRMVALPIQQQKSISHG